MSEQNSFGMDADWKAAIGLVGGGAVTVAPIGTFAWWAGWILLAGGIFWLVSSLTYGEKTWWRTFRKTGVLVGALGIAALAALVFLQLREKDPSIEDITVALVVDQLDESVIHGRVVVSSTALSPIKIEETRTISPGASSSGSSTEVRLKQSASFPFSEYFWKGGSISFEAHYNVDGEASEKAIVARFFVPPNPQTGVEISPTACCEGPKSDFVSLGKQDANMVANAEQGCHPVTVTERLQDGRPRRVFIPYMRRQFLFDPVERVVRMRSILRDEWHEISAPLGSTFNGEHHLRYCWHEPNGYMAINVDDAYVLFDLDTGVVKRGKLR